MSEVQWDATLYSLGIAPYIAFWFKGIEVRILVTKGFKFKTCLRSFKKYKGLSFRDFALEIIQKAPLSHELEFDGLKVKLVRITSEYALFHLFQDNARAEMTCPPDLKIDDFVEVLEGLLVKKISVRGRDSAKGVVRLC